MAKEGLDAKGIYDRISIRDVQLGADVLRPVRDSLDGADGFVSLEVGPELARDTDGTLAEARRLWQAVDRPNVMIKIPGTDEGVPAIEQAIYEGINVNVTLLFAVEAYVKVAEAFIRGLERRQEEGKDLDVHSVASFFVSRVDSEVDKRLEAAGPRPTCRARPRVANARAAYQRFKEIFRGERFAALAGAGAKVQRPLWASTGVKNPHYPETKYVDELVAPDTVNTMPMQTLLAAARALGDHRRHGGPGPVRRARARSPRRGSTWTTSRPSCSRTGSSCSRSRWTGLIEGVDDRREAVVTSRPPTIRPRSPRSSRGRSASGSARRSPSSVAQRVWRKDVTLWGPEGTPEVENRLGLADHLRADARAGRRPARLRRRGARPTASPTARCWAWAAPRSAPR